MRERAVAAFPLAIAAALPLAGVVLAFVRYTEDRRYEAMTLLGASLLGAVIWALVLGL